MTPFTNGWLQPTMRLSDVEKIFESRGLFLPL